jgi:SAM-dependent methyltransferase
MLFKKEENTMTTDQIRFDDGAAYEQYMGKWSQLAGQTFLDWVAPSPGLRWLDVGCGNGAFTELMAQTCAPGFVHGIDPSEGQLAFARARPVSRIARFSQGDAMALPFPDNSFDIAVMPLVIFFVPEPDRGVAEMVRVVGPGGVVAAYAWDMYGGGFPYEVLNSAMRDMGLDVPKPPSPQASRLDVMQELWAQAGLEAIATTEITVQRTYTNFSQYWSTVLGSPSAGANLARMSPTDIALLQGQLQQRLASDEHGMITCTARANAVRGTVAR